MDPFAAVEPIVGGRQGVRREPQDGTERRHRVEPPIESEDVLVEICLQVLLADAMVRSKQPSLDVGEYDVNHRHAGFGHLGVAAEYQRSVRIAHLRQAVVALPAIRPYDRRLRDALFDERSEFVGATTGHEAQPQSPRIRHSLKWLAFRMLLPTRASAIHPFVPATYVNHSHDGEIGKVSCRFASGIAASTCR